MQQYCQFWLSQITSRGWFFAFFFEPTNCWIGALKSTGRQYSAHEIIFYNQSIEKCNANLTPCIITSSRMSCSVVIAAILSKISNNMKLHFSTCKFSFDRTAVTKLFNSMCKSLETVQLTSLKLTAVQMSCKTLAYSD